jgi:hypothetical protein
MLAEVGAFLNARSRGQGSIGEVPLLSDFGRQVGRARLSKALKGSSQVLFAPALKHEQ